MRFALLVLLLPIVVCGCGPEKPAREAPPPLPKGEPEPANKQPGPEDFPAEVKLPKSLIAKALEKTDGHFIYLNVNDKGVVLLAPADVKDADGKTIATLDNPAQVQVYLERRAKEDRTIANPNRVEREEELEDVTMQPPLRSTIIFRVDRQTPFEKLSPLYKAARNAGFVKAQWRAIVSGGSDEGQITVTIPPPEHIGPVAIPVPGREPMRYVIRVTADGAGKITKINLRKDRDPRFETDLPEIEVPGKEKPATKSAPLQPESIADLGADVDALLKKLKALATAKKGLPPLLALELDGKLLHADLIRLIDAAVAAGCKDVALVLIDPRDR
jgi:biopolymer transport protein ExbD